MRINAHLNVDLVAVESADTVSMMLEMKAPEVPVDPDQVRPEYTAVVVLDRSGSMNGRRLDSAKRAIISLVGRLDDRDSFGLIVFDDSAQALVPAGRVAELGRDAIRATVASIRSGGSTDLAGGYLRGIQEARRVSGPAGATLVLLSDGKANSGIRDAESLRQLAAGAAAQGITTSTIGIGVGYDEELLAAIAGGGSGNDSYAPDPDAAAAALSGEVDGLLSKTVQAASLLVSPASEVAQVGILNNLPTARVPGGLMVELGDFYGGEERRVVLELEVPAMTALGLAQVAELTLTYVELPSLQQHTITLPVHVNVVPGDQAAGRVKAPRVERERLLLQTQKAKRVAEVAMRRGEFDEALRTLDEASGALHGAPPEVIDGEVEEEILWLDATRAMVRPDTGPHARKRLRSDYMRKGRGYKSRWQGGEMGDGSGTGTDQPPF